MDPLSIAASAVTLAGAAGAIVKTLQYLNSLRQCGGELHSLINEISDLRLVLLQIDLIARENENRDILPTSLTSTLQAILGTANSRLQELSQLVHSRILCSQAPGQNSKISRVAWIKEKGRLRALQKNLKASKLDLTALIGVITWLNENLCPSSGSTKIACRVDEVTLVTQDLQSNLQTLQNISLQRFSEQAATLQQLSSLISNLNLQEATGSASSSVGEGDAEQQLLTPDSGSQMVSVQSKSFTAISNGIRVRTSSYLGNSCSPFCSCICHKRHSLRTPRILEQFIGSLFIGYSGFPINTPPCNEFSCQQRSRPSTLISYYFPPWLLARVFSMVMLMTPLDGPVISICAPRVIDSSSKIFKYARNGDVEGIKYLFERGLASPRDITPDSHVSPLHFAVDYEQVEVCRFLLQARADPFFEDRVQLSVMDAAWNRILGSTVDPGQESQLKNMFHDTECLEKREFSVLQKTVLQLVNLDLESLLQASTSTLNYADSNGRTALSWAAARGDERALAMLLKYRADPDIANVSNMVPLHYAMRCKSAVCASILVKAGANVNFLTDVLQSPLHHAAAYQDDESYLKCLIEAEAHIDVRDCEGFTPLTWATFSNHAISASYLLERGADTASVDKTNRTALLHAIEHNSHEVLNVLLQHAVFPIPVHVEFCTLLHFIAENGDLRTVEIFRRTGMGEVDVTAQNGEGLTARDVMQQRKDIASELQTAFNSLLAHLVGTEVQTGLPKSNESGTAVEQDDTDGEEEFEDALDFQRDIEYRIVV